MCIVVQLIMQDKKGQWMVLQFLGCLMCKQNGPHERIRAVAGDFVAVIEKTDLITKKTYLETIIIDSKLSQFTDLTSNQNAAQKLGEWQIKSIPDDSKIIGKEIDGFGKSIQLKKDGSFIKLYSENGIPKTIR